MAIRIGEKIRTLRKEKNISQESLAEVIGVTFQAVSKWETGAATPDISIIPPLAYYFGVSIDELFDYRAWENEQTVDTICRQAYQCRYDDPLAAEKILREGLKQFPANEKLLTVLVYTLWAIPERDNELIAVCKALLDCASNPGVRCDVLRFLAMVYQRSGQDHLVREVLDQIPEFYFTKLSCIAKLCTGQESLEATQFQMNLSGSSLLEMLNIMEERYHESGDADKAHMCNRLSQGVKALFRSEGAAVLELPGYQWIPK